MKKSDKKVVKVNVKGAEEGTQVSLFSYEGFDKKSTDEKDVDKSTYRLVTKGRPFTIKV